MAVIFLQQDDAKTRVIDVAYFAPPSAIINSRRHEIAAEATDSPIETGATITDHVRPGNPSLNIEATITLTPHSADLLRAAGHILPITLTAPKPYDPLRRGPPPGTIGAATRLALASATGRILPVVANANVLQFLGPYDPIVETYQKLALFLNSAAMLKVLTPEADYEDMLILYLSVTVSGPTKTAQFQVVCRNVKVASTSLVAAPQPLEPRGAPKLSKGNQQPVPKPEEGAGANGTERKRSFAKGLIDKFAPGLLPSI